MTDNQAADVVSAPQLAHTSGRPLRTVQRACADGSIPGARKVGRDWLIPADAARAYADRKPYDSLRKKRRVQPPPPAAGPDVPPQEG